MVAGCPCWEELKKRRPLEKWRMAFGKRTRSTACTSAREWREVEVPWALAKLEDSDRIQTYKYLETEVR